MASIGSLLSRAFGLLLDHGPSLLVILLFTVLPGPTSASSSPHLYPTTSCSLENPDTGQSTFGTSMLLSRLSTTNSDRFPLIHWSAVSTMRCDRAETDTNLMSSGNT
jgi:hypothetical protein